MLVKSCWSTLRYATDICHDIPLFPNQSAGGSWYFCGMNFMAQSLTSSTVCSGRSWSSSKRAWSCLAIIKDGTSMHGSLEQRCGRGKRPHLDHLRCKMESLLTASPISLSANAKLVCWSQVWMWMWVHDCLKFLSEGSLREEVLQCSALGDSSVIWA